MAETHAEERDSHWFYSHMLDEFELLRLGVDMNRYSRFNRYVKHVPGEYRVARSSGWSIMQRPWERGDATYCYDFVSDIVLRWQNTEMPSIYDIPRDRDIRFRLIIGESELSGHFEGGGAYLLEEGEHLEQRYVGPTEKERYDKLEVGSEYDFLAERYGNGDLEFRRESKIILKSKITTLATHDPERWQCTIWYSDVTNPNVQHF